MEGIGRVQMWQRCGWEGECGARYLLVCYTVVPLLCTHVHAQLLVTSNDSRVRMYNLKDHSLSCKYKGGLNTSSQIKATFR